MTVCPIWKKSNELFEKIYSNCSSTGTRSLALCKKKLSAPVEAGLLYLGIKEGWANISDEWMQSPRARHLEASRRLSVLPSAQARTAGHHVQEPQAAQGTRESATRTVTHAKANNRIVLPQQQHRTTVHSSRVAAPKHHAVDHGAPHRRRFLRLAHVPRPPGG